MHPVNQSAVAVLDVGKTNKKVVLYNRAFRPLAEERITIEPKDFNGVEVEDTESILSWFRGALRRLAKDYRIRAIGVTTHGATCAVLDGEGRLVHPVISYTAARGAEIQDEFYATFGNAAELHRVTCTRDVGFANVGKILYFMKTRLPEAWARSRYILLYPSYFGYALTGERGIEPTYLGNHTYLWDFARSRWSSVAVALGADRMLPQKLASPWEVLGPVRLELAQECRLPEDCLVTQGIHDSNANFLPYLARGYGNFLLNSTGTWCVLMRPADTPELTDEEIAAKVFFNLDARGRPVRTCIFPAGMEYDTFRSFTIARDESTTDDVRQVVGHKDLFVIPGVLPDATAFPGAVPRVVHGAQVHPLTALRGQKDAPLSGLGQAYWAALNLSLAFATRKMLHLCGVEKGTTVFIEGGFANNRTYCEVLASLCPDQQFVLTEMREGTSFGAALTAWMLVDGLNLETIGAEFTIGTTAISRQDYGDIHGYERAFNRLLEQRP